MKAAVRELRDWLEAQGLNAADFRLRVEAKTIAAQRDVLRAFKEEVEPALTPAAAGHLKPTLEGIELSIEGPLPRF
ncbi:hypothetical protein [Bosea sp. 117]|uniref:hypothetical protein n=1 Tax=Bosea sp. 117 TaxID=1125973 RepID=UPI0004941F86|nr:hypothetical protein [Bosea sp. 117]